MNEQDHQYPNIKFGPGAGESWIIKITKEGIKFNREDYPEATPDDFAQAFCQILERNYDVSFTRKEKSCESSS